LLSGLLKGCQAVSLGNVTTTPTYNEKGELAAYEAAYNATTLFATSYTRDSLGRITELEKTVCTGSA
jgi:hypothetical protein